MKLLSVLSFLSILISSSVYAENNDLEAKKQFVIDFYTEVILHRNGNAIDDYIGDVYIQHNHRLPDGKEALRNFVGTTRRDEPVGRIVRSAVEGDHVYLHVEDFSGLAIIDIFRVDGCYIVEHWDVIESIPNSSANDNGVF